MLKRFLILAAFVCLVAIPAKATNAVYIADASAGADDGSSCANAKAASYFNSGGNWSGSPTGIQIGPDTTVHLCGTFTGTSNSTKLTFQGSGTSGHPINVVAEPSVNFTAPYWSLTAAINLNGKNFIVLDGLNQGTIQNTDNGNGLGNAAGSYGIYFPGGHDITIRNWTVANICVKNTGTSSGCSTTGVDADGIVGTLGNNITITGNTIHDAHWGIFLAYPSGVTTTGLVLSGNEVYNSDHGIALGDASCGATLSGPKISGNTFHDMVNWDGSPGFHHDYIHVWTGFTCTTPFSTVTGLELYNNYLYGNPGTSLTSLVFLQNNSGNVFTLSKVYNNVLVNSSSSAQPGHGYFDFGGSNNAFYANTIIGSSTSNAFSNACFYINNGATGTTLVNNSCQTVGLFLNSPGGIHFTQVDYNDWYNSGGGFYTGSYLSFSAWRAACACDSNSFQTLPNVQSTAPFQPNPTSPLINAGLNLFSLGITPLNSDINGSTRPSSGSWSIGAANSASASAPALSISPNPDTFPSQNVGTTSSARTYTVTNSGTANAVLSSIKFYSFTGTNLSDFARAGGGCALGATIVPTGNCTITVTFAPGAAGFRTARLNILGNTSASADLNGTGAVPGGSTNKVNLTTEVKSVLPPANGGTGIASTGASGNVLTSDGSGHWTSSPNPGASGGTVTVTGSPASGNLTKFSSPTVITNGDISGDCTTSGGLAITCTKVNGGTVPSSASFLTTDGSGKFVSSDLADVKIIPAANCPGGTAGSGWSFASGQFTPTCRAGSNNLGGALQAIPSAGASGQFLFEVPKDWDTASQAYINIFYGSGSNTSGTVIFTVSSACVDVSTPGGASDDPSFHAESAFSTQTMANANRMWYIGGQFTALTSGNGCPSSAPVPVIIKIVLSGTASSNINIYKAVITTPRKPAVQAN